MCTYSLCIEKKYKNMKLIDSISSLQTIRSSLVSGYGGIVITAALFVILFQH